MTLESEIAQTKLTFLNMLLNITKVFLLGTLYLVPKETLQVSLLAIKVISYCNKFIKKSRTELHCGKKIDEKDLNFYSNNSAWLALYCSPVSHWPTISDTEQSQIFQSSKAKQITVFKVSPENHSYEVLLKLFTLFLRCFNFQFL